jgi:hypothetical protein
MKTLDEVIKAFEYTYENDFFAWTYGVDALHYLKELRHILNNTVWIDSTKEENGYWKLPTLPETGNDPLTWNELKGMIGKPIWVERTEKYCVPHWAIIEDVIEWDSIPYGALLLQPNDEELYISDHAKTWQAYRKERK